MVAQRRDRPCHPAGPAGCTPGAPMLGRRYRDDGRDDRRWTTGAVPGGSPCSRRSRSARLARQATRRHGRRQHDLTSWRDPIGEVLHRADWCSTGASGCGEPASPDRPTERARAGGPVRRYSAAPVIGSAVTNQPQRCRATSPTRQSRPVDPAGGGRPRWLGPARCERRCLASGGLRYRRLVTRRAAGEPERDDCDGPRRAAAPARPSGTARADLLHDRRRRDGRRDHVRSRKGRAARHRRPPQRRARPAEISPTPCSPVSPSLNARTADPQDGTRRGRLANAHPASRRSLQRRPHRCVPRFPCPPADHRPADPGRRRSLTRRTHPSFGSPCTLRPEPDRKVSTAATAPVPWIKTSQPWGRSGVAPPRDPEGRRLDP